MTTRDDDSSTRLRVVGLGDLAAPPGTYEPSSRRDRLSLVWWDDDRDDPTPLVLRDGHKVTTLVAVWPTTADGQLVADRVDDVMVRIWVPQERTARQLLDLHRDWPLGHHDVLVRGIPGTNPVDYLLLPCLDSVLRRVRTSGQSHAIAIADRIARQTATLAAELTRKAA